MKSTLRFIIFLLLIQFPCHMVGMNNEIGVPLIFSYHPLYIDDLSIPYPNLPSYSPNVTLEDHTLHFYYNHPDCTVQLLDDDEVVFEEPFFPYTANNINLPATLTGQYELRIIEGDYYYSAVIELE